MRGIVCALAGALVLLGVAAGTAHATFPGSTGALVFGGPTVGDPFDPDGVMRAIDSAGASARWSPDGTRVAYTHRDNFIWAVWVVNADGTGKRQITFPRDAGTYHENDYFAAWSPDGTKLAVARKILDGGVEPARDDVELRIVDVASGGDGQRVWDQTSARLEHIEWSPDGSRIAGELIVPDPDAPFDNRDYLVTITPGGIKTTLAGPGPRFSYSARGKRLSWSPDGTRLAYAQRNGSSVAIYSPAGVLQGTLAVSGSGRRIGGLAFTPDGGRILAGACTSVGGDCRPRLLRATPPGRDVDPHEPAERELTGPAPSNDTVWQADFQPADHPIIFLHGFLGSTMACGSDSLWPTTKVPGDLLDLRLADDGDSNHPDACGAATTGLLRTFLGADIYGGAVQRLEALAPGRVHVLAWDWRRDPREQLGRLDALIDEALDDELSRRQALDEVVLVGHSFGGLFIRAALQDEARRKRVRRVLTLGTPYWGSPKAVFPLAIGMETPMGGVMDTAMLLDDELRELAKTLTGGFWLYPSDHYDPWLALDDGSPLGQGGVADFVESLGGSRAILNRALAAHREIDGFRKLEPFGLREVRAVVGTGVPTIGSVRFLRRTDQVVLGFESGDGTVPGRSASQGPIGTTDPLGDDVPIGEVCGIEHMPLTGHAAVFDAYGDYIRYGTPPKRTQSCPMHGVAFLVRSVDIGGSQAAQARAAAALPDPVLDALRAAEAAGTADVIAMPGGATVVMSALQPATIAFDAAGLELSVTAFDDGGAQPTTTHGPLNGRLELGISGDGAPTAALAGQPLLGSGQPGGGGTGGSGGGGTGGTGSAGEQPSGPAPATLGAKVERVTLARDGALRITIRNQANTPLASTIAVAATRPGSSKVRARLSAQATVPAGGRRTVILRRAARRLRGLRRARLTVIVRSEGRQVTRRVVTVTVPHRGG